MAYRYNPSLPTGFVEGEGGRIEKNTDEYARLSAPPPVKEEPIKRYENVNAVNVGTETPKTDATADYYTNLKETYKMPDEVRRQMLRGQAEQEVATQIAAINSSAQRLMDEERARQKEAYALTERQVSGIGRLSGLSGSSVQQARQGEALGKSQERERAALAVIDAQRARDEAMLRGTSVAAAEERIRREEERAMQVQMAEAQWMQSLKPAEANKPVEVGGVLIDPTTGKVIYDSRTSEGQKPIEVGGYLVDPVTGQVVFSPPDKAKAVTYTLKPGETVFGSDGQVIASLPANATAEKAFTLSPGEIAFDAAGNVIAKGGAKVESSPASVQEYQYALSNGYKGSYADFIAMKALVVPNAKAEVEKAEQDAQQQKAAEAAAKDAVRVQTVVDSAKALVDETDVLGSVGRVAASKIPGTKSFALAQTIETLKANLGFGSLAEMKMQSGNGSSGLGPLSNAEMQLLSGQVASLNIGQDSRTLKANLDTIYRKYQGFVDALKTTPTSTTTTPGEGDELDSILDGMGFNKVGSGTVNAQVTIPRQSRLSYVNNNPGNLRYIGQPGAVQGEGGFARFPSVQQGVAALYNDVRAKQTGASRTGLGPSSPLAQFVNVYAPPSENDTNLYIDQAAKALGVSPNTPIAQIDTNALVRFIAKKESSTVIG